jgi:hypothetical protein
MDNSNMVNDERNNFYQKRTHHFVVDVFFRNVERLPTPVKKKIPERSRPQFKWKPEPRTSLSEVRLSMLEATLWLCGHMDPSRPQVEIIIQH